MTNHRFTTKELGTVELTEEHMVFTIRRYSSFIGDKQAEECIPVKMRVIAAALGGPWEVLYLSQKSVSKKWWHRGTYLMCL